MEIFFNWILFVISINIVVMKGLEERTDDIEISHEKRLIRDLLHDYDIISTLGRPVRNASDSVSISFALGLIRMDVEEKSNMLVLSAWTKYRWRDEYLTWNPDNYGGIREVGLEPKHIWIPDIMLYNTASTESFERAVNLVVDYNGTVKWFPHRIFYSTCSIDVTDFPFDNQTCHLWFGSWTHKVSAVDLELDIAEGIDLTTFRSDFKETSKWDITGILASRMVDEMAVLTFTLYLQRRMIFSSYILTFPVIFMSFLTLLVFWLPADHADKSNLGMTIFGSLLLLLLILVESAPPTSAAIPKLGIYYCFNIVIVMLSIFLSSLITHIGGMGKSSRRPVPVWIRKVFRIPPVNAFKTASGSVYSKCVRGQRSDDELGQLMDIFKSNSAEGSTAYDKLVASLSAHLSQRRHESLTRQYTLQEEWSYVASRLDRVLMCVYLLVIIASLIWLFPQ